MDSERRLVTLAVAFALLVAACGSDSDDRVAGAVTSPETANIESAFDLISTSVRADGDQMRFRSRVVGRAGSSMPEAVGSLDGAPVLSYVWPTTLDSAAIGFGAEQGIVSLAATAHPDFDDTPLYDENDDGDNANDGALWHSHWVVLVENAACGGGLTVKDIAEGEDPATPTTWPGLPILIDSPDYEVGFDGETVEIELPLDAIGGPATFKFDGVTSLLRVSTTVGDPLLCVEAVFDVASGDLSLPGTVAS